MGKSLLQFGLAICALFVAGLLYLDMGSFERDVPKDRPDLGHAHGTPINR